MSACLAKTFEARWHRRGCSRRRGFSLVEVMISLGILGVGLTMAAALFPAAISRTEDSVNDSLGPIICHNGLAVAKAAFADPDVGDSFDVLADAANVDVLDPNGLTYPQEDDWNETKTGFVLLGRQETNGEMARLVVVAFRKQDANNIVTVEKMMPSLFEYSSPDGYIRFRIDKSDANANSFYLDSAVMMAGTDPNYAGKFAFVNGIYDEESDRVAVLDRPLPLLDPIDEEVFVVVERDGISNEVVGSPAISVLATRTGLKAQ